MRRLTLVLIILAAGGLIWFWIAGREGRLPEATRKGGKEATFAARLPAAKRTNISRPGGTPMANASRLLTQKELEHRLGLAGIEAMDCWSELSKVRRDLMEQKGANAQVVEYDGQTLKMLIPALSAVQTQQLESVILAHLRTAVGDQKAKVILADAAVRETLSKRVWDDILKCDVIYTFTKTRNENNPARNGSLGEAAFDLTVVFDPGDLDTVIYADYDKITVEGFTYSQAGHYYDFGWNAMAKAPEGYFRSEPILGVASRPPPAMVVIEDLDKNSVEIRNRLYPGSKETHQIGDPASGEAKDSAGK